jgi:hypothetical protein
MTTGEAMDDASNSYMTVRLGGAREALMLVVLVYGLAQSVEAFAADQSASVVKDIQPIVGGKPLPKAFMAIGPANEVEFPATEFRPRKLDAQEVVSSTQADPFFQPKPLQATSPWQRLAEYRSQGRVQLLTLWESRGSMVSLQAGRHGGPSLQWSSRVMNRGGATRGLLDRFVASSLGAAALSSKMAHSSAAAPAAKLTSPIPTPKYP